MKSSQNSPAFRFAPLVGMLISGFLFFPTLASAEANDAQEWVMRMDHAVEFTNYEGRMVYMRRDHIGTYQIYHRVDGENIEERLVRMDGEDAEIIRRKNEVICIFPKQRSVVVKKRKKRSREQNPLAASVPGYTPSMTQSYRFILSGRARIAGRETIRIKIAPKDVFRYGYQLWLDEKTAMPLKSQLIDSSREIPIEELRFTSIAFGADISAEKLQSAIDIEHFTWVHTADSRIVGRSAAAEITWKATDLPPGFMMTDAYLEYSSAGANPRMHLIYSDSIAFVSVFVDEGVAASEQVEGLSTMGAANAYSVMHEGWLVTALGEVPAKTVQRIAVSVRREGVR